MTDRKKPTAGFWITVILVVVVAYVGSTGPAVGLSSRLWPKQGGQRVPKVFKPAVDLYCAPGLWIAFNLQANARSVLYEYLDWWRNPADRY
jgi:hypothetical protein